MNCLTRKSINRSVFVLFLVFFMRATSVDAATYYVDSIAGNDSSVDPTSVSTPWRTVSKVNNSTFSPGDYVLFKAGGEWRESLTFPSSGTSGNPITIGKYGSGANPVFIGSDIIDNSNFIVYDGPNNTYKYNVALTIEGTQPPSAAMWENGVLLRTVSSLALATSTPGTVYYDSNNRFFYLHSSSTDPNPLTNGLTYEASSRANIVKDKFDRSSSWLVFQDMDVVRSYTNMSAMIIYGSNIVVKNCNYYDNANHSLSFYGSNNLGVDLFAKNNAGGTFLFYSVYSTGNVFRRVHVLDTFGNAVGVQTHGGAYENIVEDSLFNFAAPTRLFSNTGQYAVAESADAGTSIIARRNYITGGWSGAYTASSGAGAGSQFYNNVINGTLFTNPAVKLASTATGIKVYNNTYYTTGTQDFLYLTSGATADMKNNLIISEGSGFYMNTPTGGLTADYNHYFGSTRASPFYNGAYHTFSQWKALGFDTNGLLTNPLLTSTSTGDYTLRSSSPAVNAGANLGSTYKYALAPLNSWPSGILLADQNSYGANWDVGAYVYGTISSPTVTITNPTNSAYISSSTNLIAVTSATSPASVSSVQFYLNNIALGSPLTSTTSAETYTYTWDTTTVANGSYSIYALVTDSNSNTATSSVIMVYVDNTAPTVSITTPLSGSVISGSAVSLTAVSTDSGSDVVGVQFKIDGINIGSEILTSPYTVSLDSNQVSYGVHTITATARDRAGNYADSGIQVMVNNNSSSRSSGSVISRVNNLLSMGQNSQAYQLINQYGLSVNPNTSKVSAQNIRLSFSRSLQQGAIHKDVKKLQEFLNSQGYTISSVGAGSVGKETDYFGPLTQKALIKFQQANGIKPAVGYFGPVTRSYINSK